MAAIAAENVFMLPPWVKKNRAGNREQGKFNCLRTTSGDGRITKAALALDDGNTDIAPLNSAELSTSAVGYAFQPCIVALGVIADSGCFSLKRGWQIEMLKDTLLELTGDIVCALVTNNAVQGGELPQLISAVFTSLSSLGKEPEPIEEEPVPAVSVRSSVKGDAIACLECGARQKTLKRHLGAQHGLTPEDYRARWKLPADYPMVAPDYAAKRAELAVASGLGKKGGRKKVKAAAVNAVNAGNEPVVSDPAPKLDAKASASFPSRSDKSSTAAS